MPDIYTPHKKLSLDESMMLWRGRLVFWQYMKNKRQKYGVKFFELCTNDDLVLNVEIYSGTKFTDTESSRQTGSIVLHLMEHLYYWYLASWSKAKTITSNWKDASERWNSFLALGDISATNRKDKRDAHVISNAHMATMMNSVNKHYKSKRKSNFFQIYNNQQVGIHIMKILLTNTYYTYAKNITKLMEKNMKNFWEIIVTNLIDPSSSNHHLKPQASFQHLSTIPLTKKEKFRSRVW